MGMLDEYSRAKSKLDKSGVLATVVAQIRSKTPNGGFVKQDQYDRWYEVGDFLAKEKTSQAFRDALHERYKSSNVSKKKRRQEEQTRAIDRFRGISRSHSDGPGIEWLALSGSGDGSMSTRTTGADMYQTANMEALARLNRMNDLSLSANRLDRPQAPMRAHSSLGFSSSFYSETIGSNSDPLIGDFAQNNSYLPSMAFSSGSLTQSHASSSSVPPSPMMYGSMPSSRNVGSQEPLDAYQTSTAQNDLEMFDIISPPSRATQFVGRSFSDQSHHSMPDLTRSSDWGPTEPRPGNRKRHNSAPDLNYTGDDDDSIDDVELDPIPYEEFTPRPPSPRKTIGMEQFKKPISMTLSPTSPSVAVSADLLACLEKLNGSAITDNNPFEPMPMRNDRSTGMMDEEKVNRKMHQSAFDRLQPPLT
ncbi:hypothetical protein MPSEU_000126400 [Mayamaea pseudoterrestris]|nr:hypothetical protein MPSEU_000125100 [Mayamaea pseudoterrestris]GKY91544.1 hypothetical protein MPSEU_000126400 [Mayamaea pseudoterrestris]